jgi:hypothetical protein
MMTSIKRGGGERVGAYRPTDRPTDRLTDRLTDRPTNRPTSAATFCHVEMSAYVVPSVPSGMSAKNMMHIGMNVSVSRRRGEATRGGAARRGAAWRGDGGGRKSARAVTRGEWHGDRESDGISFE